METLCIAILAKEFPPDIGGEGRYAYGLSTELVRMGHEVHVLAGRRRTRAEPSCAPNLIDVPILPNPLQVISYNMRARPRLLELMRSQRIDVVHQAHDFARLPVRRRELMCPILATLHHPYPAEKEAMRRYLARRDYLRFRTTKRNDVLAAYQTDLCREVDQLISVSRFSANSICRSAGILPERISIVPNAVDPDGFLSGDPERLRAWLGAADESIVLCLGKLEFNKGLEDAIQAFSALDREGWILSIVGAGPEWQRLRTLASGDDRIHFPGPVQQGLLADAYAACEVFVLPSLFEGFGIVLLEAMSAGRACVATRCGGAAEAVLPGVTGLMAPVRCPGELGQALGRLIDDQGLRTAMGRRGRMRAAERFNWKAVGRQTLDAYRRSLKE